MSRSLRLEQVLALEVDRCRRDGCADGYGRSFITDSAVTDLPEPDSPTSATVSPFLTSKEMRSTASVVRAGLMEGDERSRTVEQCFG